MIALNNNHRVEVGTFKDIFLDLINEPMPINKPICKPIISTTAHLNISRTVKYSFDKKAKTKSQALARRLVIKSSAKKPG